MNHNDIEVTAKYSALLSATEVGVGSLLHAWHVPLSGHFLSLNQGFILSKASQSGSTDTALKTSTISAILKSLAPAGKRLTPMLAISAQGFLFSLGQWLFGLNIIGTLLGLVLLSLWAFAQPLLLYLVIFGQDILTVAQYFLVEIQKIVPIQEAHLLSALGIFVFIKIVLALLIGFLSFSKKSKEYELFLYSLAKKFSFERKESSLTYSFKQKLFLVLKDLIKPWFLFSMALMLIFFFVTKPKDVELLWYILRPLSVGFIVFYALRFMPYEKWILKVFRPHSKMGLSMARSIENIKNFASIDP